MQSIKNLINKRALSVSFILWIILHVSGIQQLYFKGTDSLKIVPMKLLHIVFLYVITYKLFSLFANRKTKEGKYELAIAGACFLAYVCAILITWPGTWSWDDIFILQHAEYYGTYPFQHFFSGTFQIMCLQTMPFAAGVIIVQTFIMSLISGYCVTKISFAFANSEKEIKIFCTVLFAIMFFPPILIYALSGFRMGVYTSLVLLLITKMILLYKNSEKPTAAEIIAVGVLTVLVAAWRTEGIYYPTMIFVLLLLLGKQKVKRTVAVTLLAATLLTTVAIGNYNTKLIGNSDYSLSATMHNLASVVRVSRDEDKDALDILDKVVDIQFVKDNPTMSGEALFWDERVIRDGYTEEDLSNYTGALIKLCLKYPGAVIKDMWNMFYRAAGFGIDGKQTIRYVMFTANGRVLEIDPDFQNCWDSVNSLWKAPINQDFREGFLLFISGVDADRNANIIYTLFWNMIIPIFLMLVSLVYVLVKKKWYMAVVILSELARVAVVFITSPAPYFMYYLPTYLIAYALSFVIIYGAVRDIIMKRKSGKSAISNEASS